MGRKRGQKQKGGKKNSQVNSEVVEEVNEDISSTNKETDTIGEKENEEVPGMTVEQFNEDPSSDNKESDKTAKKEIEEVPDVKEESEIHLTEVPGEKEEFEKEESVETPGPSVQVIEEKLVQRVPSLKDILQPLIAEEETPGPSVQDVEEKLVQRVPSLKDILRPLVAEEEAVLAEVEAKKMSAVSTEKEANKISTLSTKATQGTAKSTPKHRRLSLEVPGEPGADFEDALQVAESFQPKPVIGCTKDDTFQSPETNQEDCPDSPPTMKERALSSTEIMPAKLLDNASLLTDEEMGLASMLVDCGQEHLFTHWPLPPEDKELKHSLLKQVGELQQSLGDDGIPGYVMRARRLLAERELLSNPLEGWVPSAPEGQNLFPNSKEFSTFEHMGLQELKDCCFVLIAVGGYENKPDLELYARYILLLQSKCGASLLPLAIMVPESDLTDTRNLLDKHQYFGLQEDQLVLLVQENVPTFKNSEAKFEMVGKQSYKLDTKPRGSGNVHSLLHGAGAGLAHRWLKEGRKWVFFFEDLHSLSLFSLAAVLGVSKDQNLELNSVAVPRKAKQERDAISKLSKSDGTVRTDRVQSTWLELVLKATVNPEGETNDEATCCSPFPGHINTMLFKLESYAGALLKSDGLLPESITLEFNDDTTTQFARPVALECLLQDSSKILQNGSNVAFTVLPEWACGSLSKNDIEKALLAVTQGMSGATQVDFDQACLFNELLTEFGAASDAVALLKNFTLDVNKSEALILEEPDVPEVIHSNKEILSAEDLELVQVLLKCGQAHLFDGWSLSPQEHIDEKRGMLRQLRRCHNGYPGGISSYVERSRFLLADAAEGKNPFENCTPYVPSGGVTILPGSQEYNEFERIGVEELSRCCFVLVAGGLGERLGFSGIKLSLPIETLTFKTYIEFFIHQILAFERRYARSEYGALPLAIMVSDDTAAGTEAVLEQNKNFGMRKDQIVLIKQQKVPALQDSTARIALAPDNPYRIISKPHGHGDVHALLHSSGLAKLWLSQGRKWVNFSQDTNGPGFFSLPALLGVSLSLNLQVNFLTIPRKAKQAIGAITTLKNSQTAQEMTINIEYNQLEPLLKATTNPEGDTNDPQTGYSPFPGNINQMVFELETYANALENTSGLMSEFVNPKYKDSSKKDFKAPARLECMMQDYPKVLQSGASVGFTSLPPWITFSPCKNSIEEAQASLTKGVPPACASSAEQDMYYLFAEMLRTLGATVLRAPEKPICGIPVSLGPMLVFDPSFVSCFSEVRKRFPTPENIKISERSTLIVKGSNIIIESLDLDGGLYLDVADNSMLTIQRLTVRNAGYKVMQLGADSTKENTPEIIRIRGYNMVKVDQREIFVMNPQESIFINESESDISDSSARKKKQEADEKGCLVSFKKWFQGWL